MLQDEPQNLGGRQETCQELRRETMKDVSVVDSFHEWWRLAGKPWETMGDVLDLTQKTINGRVQQDLKWYKFAAVWWRWSSFAC